MESSEFSYKNIISHFFIDDKLISQRSERIERGLRFVLERAPQQDLSQKLQDVAKKKVASVELTFNMRWLESKFKSRGAFEEKYDKWLHTNLQLPASIMSTSPQQGKNTQPKKIFEQLSRRQKNRRVDELKDFGLDQLLLASQKAAKESNEIDLEHVLHLLYKDHKNAAKIRNLLKISK